MEAIGKAMSLDKKAPANGAGTKSPAVFENRLDLPIAFDEN